MTLPFAISRGRAEEEIHCSTILGSLVFCSTKLAALGAAADNWRESEDVSVMGSPFCAKPQRTHTTHCPVLPWTSCVVRSVCASVFRYYRSCTAVLASWLVLSFALLFSRLERRRTNFKSPASPPPKGHSFLSMTELSLAQGEPNGGCLDPLFTHALSTASSAERCPNCKSERLCTLQSKGAELTQGKQQSESRCPRRCWAITVSQHVLNANLRVCSRNAFRQDGALRRSLSGASVVLIDCIGKPGPVPEV